MLSAYVPNRLCECLHHIIHASLRKFVLVFIAGLATLLVLIMHYRLLQTSNWILIKDAEPQSIPKEGWTKPHPCSYTLTISRTSKDVDQQPVIRLYILQKSLICEQSDGFRGDLVQVWGTFAYNGTKSYSMPAQLSASPTATRFYFLDSWALW